MAFTSSSRPLASLLRTPFALLFVLILSFVGSVHSIPVTTDLTPIASTMEARQAAPKFRTVAYFVNWAIYERQHFPKDVQVDKLTHILYSFANIRENGEVFLTDPYSDTDIIMPGDNTTAPGNNVFGNVNQFNMLKKQNRNLKIMLSIGGYSYSGNFPKPASTVQGRTTFAKSAVALLKNLGFDGLDIDWEYPVDSAEAKNYTELLKAVRAELDAYAKTVPGNPRFELSVATSAGPQHYNILDITGMNQYLDFWNLMAYDYSGSWNSFSAHQANLYKSKPNPNATPAATTMALDAYIKKGVASNKIVLGMPLYGNAFEKTAGLGKAFTGVGAGTWEPGVYDYKKLPLAGCKEFLDEAAGASYCYNANTKVLVSYDTQVMARRKVTYMKNRNLGGAMWWETSGDKLHGQGSLITTVWYEMGQGNMLIQKPNVITYPQSEYDNIRS